MDKENFSNHIDIYGDKEHGYSGSTRGINADEIGLNKCSFCGTNHQKIVNTHTPYYWIECQCGVEVTCDEIDIDDQFKTKEQCLSGHFESFSFAVNKWQKLTAQK